MAPWKDFVKINCDGAWSSFGSSSGVGIICRDHNRLVIASQLVAMNNVGSCLEAGGLAVKQGMLLTKELKREKVIFETDNTKVTEILWFGSVSSHPGQDSWTRFCVEELANHVEWQVSLIKRETNSVVDLAAKYARDNGTSWLHLDACPLFLGPSIQSDAYCGRFLVVRNYVI